MEGATIVFLVNFVVLARMSFWNFKKDKREEGFAELDKILGTLVQDVEGFRGYMSLPGNPESPRPT